jgi:ribosome-associated protein
MWRRPCAGTSVARPNTRSRHFPCRQIGVYSGCGRGPPVFQSRGETRLASSAKPRSAPRGRTKKAAVPDPVDHLRQRVLAALEELKAKDVREIDVRGKTSIADMLIIASGTSTRHVKSIADEVVKYAKQAGMLPLGVEGQREAEWVLVDLGDIVVHVMLPRIREFYGLERLWTVGDDMPAAAANA